ncbi:MAG: polysaccharide deacetylase family protein [Lachnospiraceae bacterium]|nr:polysaccharide deacetylase family protein [Lachnospiraceae bacterium]
MGVRYKEAGALLPTSSSAKGKALPIYCVQTEEPKIALTFDAAWGNDDTQKIMEILKKHDVKVTFFMTGGWVESYPDDVRMIFAEGHDLGNHSQNHKNMSQLSDAEKEEEIMSVHNKVRELTGYDMFLFRPPYGDYDSKLIKVAKKCNYYPIQWDVDSLDWKDYGVDSIIKTVAQNEHLGNGSIILCHNGAKYTVEALDTLITTLKAEGYQFVPLSDLIYRDNYYMDHEGRQIPDNK